MKKAIIYSKDDCIYCTKAKKLLDHVGVTYEEIVIGKDVDRQMFMDTFPHIKTVPYILGIFEAKTIKEVASPIGGYEDLVRFLESLDEDEDEENT